MTTQKQWKSRIRARMAATGERYAAARAQLITAAGGPGRPRLVDDDGWLLRGGTDPDSAALANVLANAGVGGPDGPLSEGLILIVGGGLGAGYILWEFEQHDAPTLTLGFTNSGHYFDRRLTKATDRLGLRVDWARTSGTVGAAARLRDELLVGQPVIIWPDRHLLGYWQLPDWLEGHGGHPLVAYAERAGRLHLDDRNLAPLTVAGADVDRARGRVSSYRNTALVLRDRDQTLSRDRLRTAVGAGLADMVEQHGGRSDSFAVPAWRKWSRLLVASGTAKSWSRVFAQGSGLFAALLSVWEGVEPAGMTGGNLRREFAVALQQAGALLDDERLAGESAAWSQIAGSWHRLAETAAPIGVPAFARARELTAAVTGAVAEGDAGRTERADAAAELWALREEFAATPPLDGGEVDTILTAMSAILAEIHDAEKAAVTRLGSLLV